MFLPRSLAGLGKSRSRSVIVLLLLASLAATVLVGCQTGSKPYPSKEISIIVPFGPGGTSDLTGRFVADALSKQLGQPVVVVNREGAGSAVGLQELASAKADGYTIGLATSSLVTNKIIGQAKVDYTQLAPLAQMLNSPGSFAVKADSPYKNVKELLDDAKARPDKVRVGNTGTGATWHLMSVMIEDLTGAQLLDVPYDGGSAIVAALLGGHIEVGVQSASGFVPNVEGGKLRFLGIAADKRDPSMPDVPTFKEQGVDLSYGLWNGFFAPKGTPAEAVNKLSEALEKIAESPEFADFAKKNGFQLDYKNPDGFTQLLKSDTDRIESLAKKHNLTTK
ncbi:MAG: tripartite tricarboxylate transporter substrate binding protein [Sphingomonadaceae bacterium]